MSTAQQIRQAKKLLQNARHAVALTGAGVSTPSGIPDFRSPGSGIWERVDQFQVASLFAFRRHPDAFFNCIRPMIRLAQNAVPNPAHHALAEMEHLGLLQAIITQNIDGLHTRAGSQRVIQLHGNFQTATCTSCYQVAPGEEVLEFLLTQEGIPTCDKCGGVFKPNIILFGEQLPFSALQAAQQEIRRCDLILVAGSSLTVEPAASLPARAKNNGTQLILVNLQPTQVDNIADVVIHADVAEVLPQLVNSDPR